MKYFVLLALVFAASVSMAQPDSVGVHFELDPDGDGHYQIQSSYTEAAGMWDEPQLGFLRLMIERPDAAMWTTDTGLFLYEWVPDSLVVAPPDTGMVDIQWYGYFTDAFGTPTLEYEQVMIAKSRLRTWVLIEPDSTIASVHINLIADRVYVTHKETEH